MALIGKAAFGQWSEKYFVIIGGTRPSKAVLMETTLCN